jgi:ABC-type antimicrobial peptide transport system permease subunit
MADALWPGGDPLKHCVYFEQSKGQCIPVIGLARSVANEGITDKARAQFYLSLENPPIKSARVSGVIVRAAPAQTVALTRSVRDALIAEFPGAIPSVKSMSEIMEPEYRSWRLGAQLFTLFGVLALVIAGVGIYSSVSYAVGQRTHEFGVRIALGARTSDIIGQVLTEGLRTVAIGIVAGMLMTLAAGRVVAALLYGVEPNDPIALALVPLILLAIAAIAAFAPAFRAAKADPVTALRAD